MYLLTKLTQNKLLVGIVLSVVLAVLLLPAASVFSEVGDEQGGDPLKLNLGVKYASSTGLGNRDVRTTISDIIKVALGLLGIVALVIILIAGFKWMTASGNEEKVGEAKKMMLQGVIGLAIVFAAYAIAQFVLTQLYQATTGDVYILETPKP